MISKDLLGCATARNKGICDNRVNIRRDALEVSILNGLRTHLMEPELLRELCAEFTREVNRLRIERGAELGAKRRELERTERELDKAIDAILAGIPPLKLKAKIETLEGRKAGLTAFLGMRRSPRPCCIRTWRNYTGSGWRSSTTASGRKTDAQRLRNCSARSSIR